MSVFPRARPHGQQKREPRRPVVHAFKASGQVTWSGTPICAECDNPQDIRVHELPELTDDERALAVRIVGES